MAADPGATTGDRHAMAGAGHSVEISATLGGAARSVIPAARPATAMVAASDPQRLRVSHNPTARWPKPGQMP